MIVPDKWITTVSVPAVADCPVAVSLAVGVDSARRGQAWVEDTVDERVSLVVGAALADGATTAVFTVGVGSAWILTARVVVTSKTMLVRDRGHRSIHKKTF